MHPATREEDGSSWQIFQGPGKVLRPERLLIETIENDARIIITSSGSGLYGNPGQSNYGAAKAGIASFSIIAARELDRYGVTVNAIAPGARTRMTLMR